MGLVEPNATTRSVIDHPVRYSVVSAALVLVLSMATLAQIGWLWVFAVGVPVAVLMGIGNYALWRPGGPGSNWAKRNDVGDA